MVVNAQDRVASPGFAEALIRLILVERVDEHRDEGFASGEDSWVAERTAREVLAALSPWVFAEVHPEGLVLGARDLDRGFVVDVPVDAADTNLSGRDLGGWSRVVGRVHMARTAEDARAGQ